MKDYYHEIHGILRTISLPSICLLLLYSASYYALQGVALWLLTSMKNPKYTLKKAIENNFITLFINNIFFAATGKIAQIFLFSKQGIDAKEAPSIIFIDFINYQLTLSFYYTIVFIFNIYYYQSNFSYQTSLAFVGLIITLFVTFSTIFVVMFPKTKTWIVKCLNFITKKIPFKINVKKIENTIEETITHFDTAKIYLKENKKRLFIICSINFFRLTILLLMPYLIARLLHFSFTSKDILTFISLNTFVNLVLASLPIPGKHGVSESFFVVAFSTIMQNYQAATLMIVWRLLTYYGNTLIGGLLLILNKDIKVEELKHMKDTM